MRDLESATSSRAVEQSSDSAELLSVWHNEFMRLAVRSALLVFALVSVCRATDTAAAAATVKFKLDFPGANPSHYEISVSEDGHGSYVSNGQLRNDSEPADPVPLEFTLSNKVRDDIFGLSKKAHYFSGKVDSGRNNIANTGAKTLEYKDAQHSGEATYNYSPVPAVQELTSIFQNLSTSLEFGRRLSYFHKYQKLALDEDLKRMQELQQDNSLGDIQAIAPVLNEIANDSTVMNVTRARALRMLARAQK